MGVNGRSTAFQLSLTPDIALHPRDTTVRGVSLNIWGESSGFSWGIVNITDQARGFQLVFVNYARQISGLQIGLVNGQSVVHRISRPAGDGYSNHELVVLK